jgi:Ca2+-binding EF-hand superfamily protein
MVQEAQERIQSVHQRDKMKRLMSAIANQKQEVNLDDLLLTAKLANVPITEAQRRLYFSTPLAERYAGTWEPQSERTKYGLECSPRSVKWRQFDEAAKHKKIQSATQVEHALRWYEEKELAAIAEQRRLDDEAKRLAEERAAKTGVSETAKRGISDEQLKMVHKMIKQRLSTQFAEIRTAFRTFDKDGSGCISPEECTDALMSMNVGVPRKWVEHLVNIADYDRDGEINYAEFAKILTIDDITTMKREGIEEGLVEKKKDEFYKPGITYREMREAQQRIRSMLAERGGLTKMFRAIDVDKSGSLSRKEVRMLVLNLNLESIVRPQIVEELINLMDTDGDDEILYKEFARVCTSAAGALCRRGASA